MVLKLLKSAFENHQSFKLFQRFVFFRKPYNILQVLSLTLFEKLPLIQLLDKSNNNPMSIEDSIQLNLFDNLLGH